MARVTTEDCVDKIPNRFELVMLAAQRARKIGSGAPLTVERDNDKNPVVALREIAQETIENENLKEDLTRSHQRVANFDDDDADIDLMDGEQEWSAMAEAQKAAGGMYADEEIIDEDDAMPAGEPSLEDLAGGAGD